MGRIGRIVLGLAVVAAVVAGGVWWWLGQGPVEVTSETSAPAVDAGSSDAGSSATGASEGSSAAPATGERTVFAATDESVARFRVGEVLRGEDVTVEGTSDRVAGEIALDRETPEDSQIGQMVVNARAFRTDADRRDAAIQRFILQSDQDAFETITFAPTEVRGLPSSIDVGTTSAVEVDGDLTIRDITRPVTFAGDVTLEQEDRLVALLTSTVERGAFELTIPDVPFVASVEEQVELELDLVAAPAAS